MWYLKNCCLCCKTISQIVDCRYWIHVQWLTQLPLSGDILLPAKQMLSFLGFQSLFWYVGWILHLDIFWQKANMQLDLQLFLGQSIRKEGLAFFWCALRDRDRMLQLLKIITKNLYICQYSSTPCKKATYFHRNISALKGIYAISKCLREQYKYSTSFFPSTSIPSTHMLNGRGEPEQEVRIADLPLDHD